MIEMIDITGESTLGNSLRQGETIHISIDHKNKTLITIAKIVVAGVVICAVIEPLIQLVKWIKTEVEAYGYFVVFKENEPEMFAEWKAHAASEIERLRK